MFVYFVKGMSPAPPLGKSGVSGYSTGGRAPIFFFGSSLGSPCSLLDSFSSVALSCWAATPARGVKHAFYELGGGRVKLENMGAGVLFQQCLIWKENRKLLVMCVTLLK